MNCLSVIQPWASLIVYGKKQFETRGWKTDYRGRLAIHASRKFDYQSQTLCEKEPYKSLLKELGLTKFELPRGAVVGFVDLVDVIPTSVILVDGAADALQTNEDPTIKRISKVEHALGDYRPKRFAWMLQNPTILKEPIKMSGRLGIFEVPDQLLTVPAA